MVARAGFVEARTGKNFIRYLEAEDAIDCAHPFTKEFSAVVPSAIDGGGCMLFVWRCWNDVIGVPLGKSQSYFVGIKFSEDMMMRKKKKIDLHKVKGHFLGTLMDWDMRKEDMTVDLTVISSK